MEEFKLCYVRDRKAWFTNNFEKQWGDDWDDAPYEYNAGDPYDHWYETEKHEYGKDYIEHEIKLKTLYFEIGDSSVQPCDSGEFSAESINKGRIAWISTNEINIFAGETIEEFKKKIKSIGGKIYTEEE